MCFSLAENHWTQHRLLPPSPRTGAAGCCGVSTGSSQAGPLRGCRSQRGIDGILYVMRTSEVAFLKNKTISE